MVDCKITHSELRITHCICTPPVGGEGRPTPPVGEAGEGVRAFGK